MEARLNVTSDDCATAQEFAASKLLSGIFVIHSSLDVFACFMSGFLLCCFVKNRRPLHILIANSVVLTLLLALTTVGTDVWNGVNYNTYDNPCELMITVWMSIALRAPYYVYVVGYTCIHMFMCFERIAATSRFGSYSNSSSLIGLIGVGLTYFLTLLILTLVFKDDLFYAKKYYTTASSNINAGRLLLINQVILAVDVFITSIDCALYRINIKWLTTKQHNYQLNKSFQLKENVAIVRFMIWFSGVHALIFITYSLCSIFVRTQVNPKDTVIYATSVEVVFTLVHFHAAIMPVTICCFLKQHTRIRPQLNRMYNETQEHFKQLRLQFDCIELSKVSSTSEPRNLLPSPRASRQKSALH
ncbi:hypothetical protein M3Y98_00816000 [Aphelenchoides besseyi]|nr:hypothetical protein M3Y98_00816000 [Aphelenchoides besseyi]